MQNPYDAYQQLIASGEFLPDKNQEKIMLLLDEIHQEFQKKYFPSLKKIFSNTKKHRLKSLYLWGEVGRGKTWLMDLFFNNLDTKEKQREHFHTFMRNIHTQLKSIQGQKDPLIQLVKSMAKKIKILCLDEFFVADIADAMILAKLLEAFFKANILLVLTSNTHPDNLYQNGLQRSQFLRAIELIHQNMLITKIESPEDYRFKTLDAKKLFFYPSNTGEIKKLFLQLAVNASRVVYHQPIYLYDRPLLASGHADNIIWFDFKPLCSPPRSQKDYLLLAEKYSIMILDNVDKIPEKDFNTLKYFMYLIDILYDAKILLILNLAVPLSEIYPHNPQNILSEEFKRTLSRLNEMRSLQYIKKSGEYHSSKRNFNDDSSTKFV